MALFTLVTVLPFTVIGVLSSVLLPALKVGAVTVPAKVGASAN